MTAWVIYNSEASKKFSAEGKRKEAFMLASEAWKNSTEEEKQPYIKRANEEKRRVDKQKEEISLQGYYTLRDGTKSTDSQNAMLFKVKRKKRVVKVKHQTKVKQPFK